MPAYVVLRDLRGASTAGPFEGGAASIDEKAPSEPRVEVEELAKDDVRALARDPGVRALAPVMPTRLVRPVELDADAAATTAWGIGAVGADSSTRTGADVVVAVLDTGIDAAHPAFTGVTLVEQDFTARATATASATAATAPAPSWSTTSTAPGSAWPAASAGP